MIEQVQAVTESGEQVSKEDIEMLCKSKAEEFKMLGYEYVTGKEVWDCVRSKYIKQGKEPGIHRIVNDILSLKPTQFMNYMTMEAYKGSPFS